jgi:cyanophycin synthetase
VLKLEALKQCLWRNIHAAEPAMAGTIAFGDAWEWTTERLPRTHFAAFNEKLPASMPSGDVLGAAEFVAHLAQRIQLQADVASPTYGVASRASEERRAVVYFSCYDFTLASQSLSLAVQIVDRLVTSAATTEHLAKMLESCREMVRQVGLDPTTVSMVQRAMRRGIPWVRLSPSVRHVQLGHGCRQRRLANTMLGNELGLARYYANDKSIALSILSQIKLPAGRFAVVRDIADARKKAAELGYPLVLKPVEGREGQSVFVDLRTEAELIAAATAARIHERPHMLQSYFSGSDHRLLVAAGKLIAASRKDPASVTGDGKHTVAELVEIENRDPQRVSRRLLDRVALDERSAGILTRQGLTSKSVVEAGRVVRVNAIANVSAGAKAVDVLGVIHPDNARAALRAAKAIGLNVCGIDFVSPDISKSWHEVGGGICEVNTTVGLRPHLQAAPHIDVYDLLLETMLPQGDDGRIPTAMVTGTMGKTSTSTMLASILASAGHVVGSATTEGVRIDGELIEQGDLASADGAAIVLRDATVTAAVLETARGGIVKTGLYVDRCDVAAVLNFEREQIGMDGVETIEDMVGIKRRILDVARKAVVLNADDPRCLALADEFKPRLRTILYSKSADSAAIRNHLAGGGEALCLTKRDGRETIVLASASSEIPLLATDEIPVTNGGLIWFHGVNAMSAAALAIGLGVGHDAIKEGLRRYGKDYAGATLRSVFAEGFPMRVMFDSSGKPPVYASAVTVTDKLDVAGKKICVITVPGNRPDWGFDESAAALAGHFQRYVCFERAELRRGRHAGEIASRLANALISAGVPRDAVATTGDHEDAARLLAGEAKVEDFIIVFGADTQAIVENYRQALRGVRERA